MKALTLYQPWATLVAIGAKTIETRSWSTNYRGPLAIHASKNPFYLHLQGIFPFCESLKEKYPESKRELEYAEFKFPMGCIIATCELDDVVLIPPFPVLYYSGAIPPEEPERSFGDYMPGRYAWILDSVMPSKPFPIRGALGLWEFKGAENLEDLEKEASQ